MVGAIMAVLGALRMGSVIRYVSREVMAGFIFATALLIVLGQLKDLVGFSSSLPGNKLVKALDILRHVGDWEYQAALLGILSIGVLVLLKATPLARMADVLVVILATICVPLAGWTAIETVGDIASVPSGAEALPELAVPDLSLVPVLLGSAFAAAVVGLSESSGVGAAYPNPDGSRSDMSRDFLAQGLGNLFGAIFQSMPSP